MTNETTFAVFSPNAVLHVLPVSQAVFSNLARGPGDPRGGMLLGVLSDKAADSIH